MENEAQRQRQQANTERPNVTYQRTGNLTIPMQTVTIMKGT